MISPKIKKLTKRSASENKLGPKGLKVEGKEAEIWRVTLHPKRKLTPLRSNFDLTFKYIFSSNRTEREPVSVKSSKRKTARGLLKPMMNPAFKHAKLLKSSVLFGKTFGVKSRKSP